MLESKLITDKHETRMSDANMLDRADFRRQMGSQIGALYVLIALGLYLNNYDSQSQDRQIYRNECCTLQVAKSGELRPVISSSLHDTHELK